MVLDFGDVSLAAEPGADVHLGLELGDLVIGVTGSATVLLRTRGLFGRSHGISKVDFGSDSRSRLASWGHGSRVGGQWGLWLARTVKKIGRLI